MGLIRTGVSAVSKLSVGVRDMGSFRQVGLILAKYGLSGLLAGRSNQKVKSNCIPHHNISHRRYKNWVQHLLKFGQILSTRPDILSEEYLQAFQSLQDEVSSLAFADVSAVLEAELKKVGERRFLIPLMKNQ